MRRPLVVALACLAASPLALAQTAPSAPAAPAITPTPAAVQLATRLYADVQADSVFASVGGDQVQREGMAAKAVAGDKASCPALQKPWQTFVQKVEPIYQGMADAQFKQGAINIYATSFTESELREITNFIESPTGRKWGSTSAEINQRMMALAADRAKAHEAPLRAAVTEFETSFKTALATCPAAPAAPPKKR
ncbi:MAG: DUF2059 domain-containing protein [Proteobacteria bacterium]|nr:DUF2059 domain-containing protein [Pseudomonadota bacterium]